MAKVKHLEQSEVKSRKKWIVIGVAILIITAIASAAFYFKSPTKIVDPKDPTQYTKSQEFKDLDFKQKRDYMKNLRPKMKTMSEEERRKIHTNMRTMMQARMKKHLNDYFKMSREEKNAQLDADIQRIKARIEARQNNTNQNQRPQGGPNGERKQPNANDMRERESNMDPTTKAQREVYRREIQARAAATGVTLPSGRGPRR